MHAEGRNDENLIRLQQVYVVIHRIVLALVQVDVKLKEVVTVKSPGIRARVAGIKGLKAVMCFGHGGQRAGILLIGRHEITPFPEVIIQPLLHIFKVFFQNRCNFRIK